MKKIKLSSLSLLFVCFILSGAHADELFGTFSAGFAKTDTGAVRLYSITGQSCQGEMKNATTTVASGFFYNPTVLKAILNDRPVITSDTIVMALMGKPFIYVAKATDPESNPAISFSGYPTWLTVSGDTLRGTVPANTVDTSFQVTASDGSLSAGLRVHIVSVFQNMPPVISSKLSDSTPEGAVYVYTATAEDPNKTIPQISFQNVPSWLTIDGTMLKGVAPENAKDTTFTIIATDAVFSDTARVFLKVIKVDNPPVIISAATATATVGQLFSYTAEVKDPDSKPVVLFSQLPTWLTADSISVSGTPSNAIDTSFLVRAMDNKSMDTLRVHVKVNAGNRAPVISANPYLLALLRTPVVYYLKTVDPDNDPLTISFDGLPSWLTRVGDSLVGTAPAAEQASSFTIVASDAVLTDSLFVRVSVKTSNTAPSFVSENTLSLTEDSAFVHHFKVADPDSNPLFLSFQTSLPSWIKFSGDSIYGKPTLPLSAPAGLIVAVTDGLVTATQTLLISVKAVNDVPKIVSLPDSTAQTGKLYEYQVRATDEENDTLTYSLVVKKSGMAINPSTGLFTWTPADTQPGIANVQIDVADGSGAKTAQMFKLNVKLDTRPTCVISAIDSPQKGEITVKYQLADLDSSELAIEIFYMTASRKEWKPLQSITGATEKIPSLLYKNSFIWNTVKDLGETFSDSVQIRIVPKDLQSGKEGVSNWFKVDNSPLLTVVSTQPKGIVYAGAATTITVATKANCLFDSSSITGQSVYVMGTKSGMIGATYQLKDSLLNISLNKNLFAGESVTVFLSENVKDRFGKKIQPFSFSYQVALLGDFNKDREVGLNDISYLSDFWYKSKGGSVKSDLIEECGPDSGEAPDLKLQRDSVFNYKDIGVFIKMWSWCFNHPKKSTTLAKRIIPSGSPKLVHVQAENREKNRIGLQIATDSVKSLMACRIRCLYKTSDLGLSESEPILLTAGSNGSLLHMQRNDDNAYLLEMAALSENAMGVNGSGSLAKVGFTRKSPYSTNVTVEYELFGKNNVCIERGSIDIPVDDLQDQNGTGVSDGLTIKVVPNPFKASSRGEPFVFRHTPQAYNWTIGDLGTMFEFTVGKKLSKVQNQITGHISIYSVNGLLVATTPSGTIVPDPVTGKATIFWNGQSQQGVQLDKGIYRAVIFWNAGAQRGKETINLGIK